MSLQVNHEEKTVTAYNCCLAELANIIDTYEGYTILIGDEFDKETDIGGEILVS